MNVIDYGRSFVCTPGEHNSPRFWIESRCRIIDDESGAVEDYYQCGSCKSEHTFAEKGLFQEDNYDFLPVFGEKWAVIYRRKAWLNDNYMSIRPSEDMWGGADFRLVEPSTVRELKTTADMRAATRACVPLVSQTEITNQDTKLRATIECPIKTMNIQDKGDLYQVDTGPVIFPDLTQRRECVAEGFSLAFVAFNVPHFADFVIEAPTPILEDGAEVTQVRHYSEIRSVPAKNTVYAAG